MARFDRTDFGAVCDPTLLTNKSRSVAPVDDRRVLKGFSSAAPGDETQSRPIQQSFRANIRRDNKMGKTCILVTGGAGYIGSHCCRALGAAGYEPVVYDNLSTGHRSFVRTEMAEGDLVQKELIVAALKKYNVAAVIHFAAASLVGDSVVDPQTYYMNNVVGTLSLLQAMREAGCRRMVFSSTGAVYGNADSKAVPENFPCNPINPYGASKWMIGLHLIGLSGRLWLRSVLSALFQRKRR